MFGGAEHLPYIALCRELRLERLAVDGDWFWVFDVDREPTAGSLVMRNDDGGGPSYANPDSDDWCAVWLPRLDQWLTMLAAARHPRITFDPRPWPPGHSLVRWETWVEKPGQCWVVMSDRAASPECPTREEAAARLWMAVAGRAERG